MAAAQEAELKEAEVLKASKAVWMKAFEDAKDKAQSEGLIDQAKQEYLLAEIIGKKLVPDGQITEAIRMILEEKHLQEEAVLLNKQHNERLIALKPAIEKIEKDMKLEREALLEKLVADGADETMMKAAVAEFAEGYSQKQMMEEEKISGLMEPMHIKQQTDLKMSHMQEINKLTTMYSDPENVKALQALAGEAQLKEMAKFRASLEEERKEREIKLINERKLAEEQMRKENEEAMLQMHLSIQAEQAKVEEEIERRKKEIARKKEEAEKKQEEALNSIHANEKARILADFEKEAQAAENAKNAAKSLNKAKLQEKLAKRLAKKQDSMEEINTNLNDRSTSISDTTTANASPQQRVTFQIQNEDARLGGNTPEYLVKPLSLIESKLSRIEKIIETLNKNNVVTETISDKQPNLIPNQPTPFHDSNEPIPGNQLEIIPEQDIQVQVILF